MKALLMRRASLLEGGGTGEGRKAFNKNFTLTWLDHTLRWFTQCFLSPCSHFSTPRSVIQKHLSSTSKRPEKVSYQVKEIQEKPLQTAVWLDLPYYCSLPWASHILKQLKYMRALDTFTQVFQGPLQNKNKQMAESEILWVFFGTNEKGANFCNSVS